MNRTRKIPMFLWENNKLTPDEMYVYLYAVSNPHSNSCGCYAISPKIMAFELGLDQASVMKVLCDLELIHGLLRYNIATKEMLVHNWDTFYGKIVSSRNKEKLLSEIHNVKCSEYREILLSKYHLGRRI